MPGCAENGWHHSTQSRQWLWNSCPDPGIIEEAGQRWCRRHAPSTKLAQKVARAARHARATATALRNQEIAEAREEVIRAAKNWLHVGWDHADPDQADVLFAPSRLRSAVRGLEALERKAMRGDDND